MKQKQNTTMVSSSSPFEKKVTEAAEPKKKTKSVARKKSDAPTYTKQAPQLEEMPEELTNEQPAVEEIVPNEEAEAPVVEKKHSLFGRKSEKRAKKTEARLSVLEQVCKKSGLTEDDIHMMLELGYENELGRLVGYENLKHAKSDILKYSGHEMPHRYSTSFGYRGSEFVSNASRDNVLAAYVRDRKLLILRLLLTSLCAFLLFFIDQPSLLQSSLPAFMLGENRLWLDLLGTALLIPVFLLSKKQIEAGLRSLFRFAPTPYSYPALIAPIAILYSIPVLILGGEMLRTNFLVSAIFVLVALCDTLRLSCEIKAFRMISGDGVKHVLAEAAPRKKKLRNNNKIVKIMNDDLGKNIFEVRKTEQAVGFFRRFNTMDSATLPFSVSIICMLAFSVLFGFAASIYTDSITKALSLAMTVLLVSMPLTAFLAFFYPLCRANRILARKKCVLLGEGSVEELNCEKTVVFRDTLLYRAAGCTEIAIREGDDFRNDLHIAKALLRTLGGPLQDIGAKIMTLRSEPEITVTRVQEHGVEATADGQHHLLLGSADFLRHAGVRIPRESTDRELRRTDNVGILYLAIDGALKLSYEVEYEVKPDFETLIRDLANGGVEVAISSYDPSITDAFLEKTRAEYADPVTVRKPNRYEEDKPADKIDTPVVALGKETDVVYPLFAAKSISSLRRFAWRMQLISSILGTAAVALLMVFNPATPLSIVAVLGYQAAFALVFLFSARAELSEYRFRING